MRSGRNSEQRGIEFATVRRELSILKENAGMPRTFEHS